MRRIGLFCVALLVVAVSIVQSAPNSQANIFELFLSQIRADLELVADAAVGEGVRPADWTFNFEWSSETAVVDLWFDNESLAETIFGIGTRPQDWFGATTSDMELLARNIRHDLELSADEVFGVRTRPDEWRGSAPIFKCNRSVQNLVRIISNIYSTQDNVSLTLFNYCEELERALVNDVLRVVYESATSQLVNEIPDRTLTVRGDLERLANEMFGVNTRPPGWRWQVGMDGTSPTLALDINTDIDILLTEKLPAAQRPNLLSGLTASPAITVRNLRYNLEAITDTLLGRTTRPNGWQGTNPVERCDPLTQGLVLVAERNYAFVVDETLGESPDFCALVGFTANSLVESPPPPAQQAIQESTRYMAESRNAFSYLDVGTRQYMGVMPYGTQFRAWYRNYGESNMMFVSGDNFALYVDRRWTTMEIEVFRTLPTLDGVRPLTFCDARWCNGPGPTPTPTTSGPLLALYQQATLPAPAGGDVPVISPDAKTQVSWNYIRVTYLLDRPEAGVAQVGLEICAEPQQINCEPVISVFDNNLGVAKPVLSTFNGLNVYEFTYGYTSNLRIDGATRFSPDIWISDPTIR